jgi:pyridoxal phosphate enzyme (YggS family)
MDISDKVMQVQQRIVQAELKAGRQANSVQLIAVSKTKSVEEIGAAWHAGLRHFGESYLQEAMLKQQDLTHYPITWHFLGPIQSNKTRDIANAFSWVHSLDRLKIAQRLNEQRHPDLAALNVCIQVNISAESSKSGVAAEQVEELALAITQLPRLKLRGLMGIPAKTTEPSKQRAAFRQLSVLAQQLVAAGMPIDQLSMGMSADLEAAILEGSTMVRVGTALFGDRQLISTRA